MNTRLTRSLAVVTVLAFGGVAAPAGPASATTAAPESTIATHRATCRATLTWHVIALVVSKVRIDASTSLTDTERAGIDDEITAEYSRTVGTDLPAVTRAITVRAVDAVCTAAAARLDTLVVVVTQGDLLARLDFLRRYEDAFARRAFGLRAGLHVRHLPLEPVLPIENALETATADLDAALSFITTMSPALHAAHPNQIALLGSMAEQHLVSALGELGSALTGLLAQNA